MFRKNGAMANTNDDVALRAYSVINNQYIKLGLAWGRQARQVSQITPMFVCADHESAKCLEAEGFECICKPPETTLPALESKWLAWHFRIFKFRKFQHQLSDTEKSRWGKSRFRSDKAIYTNFLKMVAAFEFLGDGHPILYSDVDAVWIKDPVPEILRQDADIAFQPGSKLTDRASGWPFNSCAGFFYMRPCENTQKIVHELVSRFVNGKNGNDQYILNQILRRDFAVEWPELPWSWDNCTLEGGWVEPIRVVCCKTRMKLVALPHAYYQRFGTHPAAVKHAVVCHPTADKEQKSKLEQLRSLGIDLQHSCSDITKER